MSYRNLPADPPAYSDYPLEKYTSPYATEEQICCQNSGPEYPEHPESQQISVREAVFLGLAMTIGPLLFGYIVTINFPLRAWCLSNLWLFFASLAGFLVFNCGALLTHKHYPVNLHFLIAFIVCESYAMGLAVSLFF